MPVKRKEETRAPTHPLPAVKCSRETITEKKPNGHPETLNLAW
jgi:hypothetical protein